MTDHKRELRCRMRTLRRALPDREERSASITDHLVSLDVIRCARRVMAYRTIEGEVDTAPLLSWCRENDVETAMPEDALDATWPDVIIVPGTAFTVHGDRLGQGGGWYDRFLLDRRSEAVLIGVAFEPQIVDSLPIERHDVRVDCIVTDAGPRWCGERPIP